MSSKASVKKIGLGTLKNLRAEQKMTNSCVLKYQKITASWVHAFKYSYYLR